jgi:hypothetical protein
VIGPGTRRALTILRDYGPLTPREFAEKMWPDSPGWNRVHKCGPTGASRGRAMAESGGGFLGKLRKQGLAEIYWDRRMDIDQHIISEQGRRVLGEEGHV